VLESPAIDLNMLSTQILIVQTIKNVGGLSWFMYMFSASVFHLGCHRLVASKCLEVGNERYVCEFLTRFAVRAKSWLFAIWTFSKSFVRSSIAAAGVQAAII